MTTPKAAPGTPAAPGGSTTLAGRTVARIGFGAMQLAEGRGDRPAPDRAVAITVLRSAVSPAQLRQALPAGIECVQNAYSLLDRSSGPLLTLCAELNLAWVPFFPLGSAFPGRPKVTEHPVVVAVAESVGATPAQVGLAWLLDRYERALLIPGTASPAHLADNIAAGSIRLGPDAIAALDAIAPL